MDHHPSEIRGTLLTCIECGYDLSGTPLGGFCPECGTPVQRSIATPGATRSSNAAVTSMVLGILSIVVCGLIGPFAIWQYYVAREEVRRGHASRDSMSMATAGLILGWISIALTGLGFLFFLVMIAADL